jgi:hypothetical protein
MGCGAAALQRKKELFGASIALFELLGAQRSALFSKAA